MPIIYEDIPRVKCFFRGNVMRTKQRGCFCAETLSQALIFLTQPLHGTCGLLVRKSDFYVGHIAKAGTLMDFLSSSTGFLIIIVLPMLLFFIYQVYNLIMISIRLKKAIAVETAKEAAIAGEKAAQNAATVQNTAESSKAADEAEAAKAALEEAKRLREEAEAIRAKAEKELAQAKNQQNQAETENTQQEEASGHKTEQEARS